RPDPLHRGGLLLLLFPDRQHSGPGAGFFDAAAPRADLCGGGLPHRLLPGGLRHRVHRDRLLGHGLAVVRAPALILHIPKTASFIPRPGRDKGVKNWLFCLFWEDAGRSPAFYAVSTMVGWAGGGSRVECSRTNASARWLASFWRALRASLAGKVRSPSRLSSQAASAASTSACEGQRPSLSATSSRPRRLRSLRSALAWSSARNCSTVCPRTCRNWSKLTRWACRLRWKRRCSAK